MDKEKLNIYVILLTLPYLVLIVLIVAYFIDKNANLHTLPAISEKPYPKLDFSDEEFVSDSIDTKLAKLEFAVIKKLAKEQDWEYSKGALGNWKILQTPHFYINSEARKDESFLAGFCLEEFIKAIRKILPTEREAVVNVRIFKSDDKLRNYAKVRESPNARAFYDTERKEIVASFKTGFDSDILHEVVHAYLSYVSKEQVPWFSEGLAEYFANFDVLNNNIVFGAVSKRHIATIKKGNLFTLDELMQLDKNTFYKGNYKLAYAQSWKAVWLWLNGKEVVKTIGFPVTF